jgi:hypothetical protein
MGCFDNIIAIRELCESPVPTSGFYLNDIGINKTEIEQIITSEYPSVQAFIDQKAAFAVQKVTSEIYSYLSPMFKADSVLAGARIGSEDKNKTLITQSGLVGVKVKIHNPNSYIDFVLSDLSLWVDVTQTVNILVYDLTQGKLLQTMPVQVVAGEITTVYDKVIVPAPRKSMLIWIGYDATGINSYKTVTHNGCSDCFGDTFNHKFIQATGATVDNTFLNGSVGNLSHTAGIAFNYSVNCNHFDWLCSHRSILGIPFLYKTGIEICNHALLSAPNQRTMAITNVNVDLMEQKLAYFTDEYDKSMRNILTNMRVPQDRNCFECSQRVVSKTILP